MDGDCNVEEVFYKCGFVLFMDDVKGRQWVFIFIKVGVLKGDFSNVVVVLKMIGVKIIVVGIGVLVDNLQFFIIVFFVFLVLNVVLYIDLIDIIDGVCKIVLKGI